MRKIKLGNQSKNIACNFTRIQGEKKVLFVMGVQNRKKIRYFITNVSVLFFFSILISNLILAIFFCNITQYIKTCRASLEKKSSMYKKKEKKIIRTQRFFYSYKKKKMKKKKQKPNTKEKSSTRNLHTLSTIFSFFLSLKQTVLLFFFSLMSCDKITGI